MNRDRITTLAILAALGGLVVYIAFHTYWGDEKITTPLQGEAATNPYYVVERLAHAVGVRTQQIASLRVLPPTSNALFLEDLRVDVAHATVESLEHWVEHGGRLVVSSTIAWHNQNLQTWSGIAPVIPEANPARTRHPPVAQTQDCPALHETQHGAASGAVLHVCFLASAALHSERVPDWGLQNDDGFQLLRVAIGRGSVTVIGPPYLLNVRNFLLEDDAQAFMDSVPLRRGDQLMILSESKAEPFLALLWRLAAPAIVLFALATLLLIWRNLPRFGSLAPVPIAARRSLAEQIRANARFAWRTGKLAALHSAACRALDRDAEKRIATYASLEPHARATALGRWVGVDAAVLDAAMTPHTADAAPAQRAAIALLEQTRRTLNVSPRQKGTA